MAKAATDTMFSSENRSKKQVLEAAYESYRAYNYHSMQETFNIDLRCSKQKDYELPSLWT